MTRTLITEVLVGTVGWGAFLYLFPAVASAQIVLSQSPQESNMALIVAGLMLTLLSYALIAAYCYGTIIERIGYFFYESLQEYLEYRRREYL